MSRPPRNTLQIWECPHCRGQFKVDQLLKNQLPSDLVEKWSHYPRGFTFNWKEWVCPHCQKYITPVDHYRMTKNGQPIRVEQEWNAIQIREVTLDTKEKAAWNLLPFVELKSIKEIVLNYNYPRSFETGFRLHVWQESCTFSQYELTEINQRKRELFKNPFQYFYYGLFIFLRSLKKEKLILHKRFEPVRRLMLDEIDLKQRLANREQEDKPNMLRLLDLLGDVFERAEIYRHLGMFDECIEALSLIDTEGKFEIKLKKEMLKRAKRKDVRVFKVEDGLDEERAAYTMQLNQNRQ